MFQIVDGTYGYAVDLKEIPPLPISDDGCPGLKDYAFALTKAIQTGVVKEPGKYLITVNASANEWKIFTIVE